MIKEQEAGLPAVDLCRKHGMITATFYKLKSKYGGLEMSDVHRLRRLEDENGKLNRLLADSESGLCDYCKSEFFNTIGRPVPDRRRYRRHCCRSAAGNAAPKVDP